MSHIFSATQHITISWPFPCSINWLSDCSSPPLFIALATLEEEVAGASLGRIFCVYQHFLIHTAGLLKAWQKLHTVCLRCRHIWHAYEIMPEKAEIRATGWLMRSTTGGPVEGHIGWPVLLSNCDLSTELFWQPHKPPAKEITCVAFNQPNVTV